MKFISYYTPNYENEAFALIESLKRHQLRFFVNGIPNLGTWDKNTHYKPIFVLEQIKNEDAVIWTDADSRVITYPSLFENIDCDIAFHRFRGQELLSGTVYFKNTPKTIELLNKWIEINNENPEVFDQKNLDSAINSVKDLRINELPPEYCFIFDLSRQFYGGHRPVIEHYQSSRKNR